MKIVLQARHFDVNVHAPDGEKDDLEWVCRSPLSSPTRTSALQGESRARKHDTTADLQPFNISRNHASDFAPLSNGAYKSLQLINHNNDLRMYNLDSAIARC